MGLKIQTEYNDDIMVYTSPTTTSMLQCRHCGRYFMLSDYKSNTFALRAINAHLRSCKETP